jgi:F0F1-type ATP synthase assembly protein I
MDQFKPSQGKLQREVVVQQESPSAQKSGPSGIGLIVEVSNLAWNLVTPIVGGVLLGHYLDSRNGENFTWTLSLLVLGVLIAFMNLYELNIEHRQQPVKDEENSSVDQVNYVEAK